MAAKLLKQFAFPLNGLHPTIESLSKYKQKDQRPDLLALVKMFTECAEDYTSVSVVLDAFDECFQAEQGRVAELLLKHLCDVGIRIHITTRGSCVEVLTSALKGAPVEEIRADCKDIENYLEKQIQKRAKSIDNPFKAELIKTIRGRAAGM